MEKIFRVFAKKTAVLLCAVLLFTSAADLYMPLTEVIAADVVAVSQDDAAVSQDDAVLHDGEEPGQTAVSEVFSISVAQIQYGEDGSNESGNLDRLFNPVLLIDGSELKPGSDYSVSYKFFTDKEALQLTDAEAFDAAEGAVLSEIPAGTEVCVMACADTSDARYLASTELTIEKRKISLNYAPAEDRAVESRDVSENGIYVIPQEDIDYSAFSVIVQDGFAYELDAADILSGDILVDLSAVDLSVDSLSEVPMEAEPDPAINDNYELDKNIHGNLYVHKAQYYVTFIADNNGEIYTKTYPMPEYKYSGTVTELLTTLGKTGEILSKTEGGQYNLAGFIDGETEILTGWCVYSDGFNALNNVANSDYTAKFRGTTVNLNPDATTYEHDKTQKEYHLSGKRDYLFVAQISKAAAKNLYVSVIPAVAYDPRGHVALGTKVNLNKQIPDLRIKVNYTNNGTLDYAYSWTELKPETDYSIKYYNNVNASMKVGEDGTYVPIKTGDDRPHAVLSGKGKYKGFSATVYFDILPVNFSETEYGISYIHEKNDKSEDPYSEQTMDEPRTYTETYYADLHGLRDKHTYILKNGKVKGINLKVTKGFYTTARDFEGNSKTAKITVNLIKDKDYVFELYKWNDEPKGWVLQEGIDDPNKLTSAGHYLVVVRGKGNYCGARFDFWDRENFNPGTDGYYTPSRDLSSDFQFIISESRAHDLTYSKITIGKRSIDYDGEYHKAGDFNIVVKDADKNILEYGKDYDVEFRNKYQKTKINGVSFSVRSANVYSITIFGIGDYYGSKSSRTVTVKGLKLRKSWFCIGEDWIELTEKGKAAGLNMEDDSDPYFVNAIGIFKKSYALLKIGGENSGAAIDPAHTVNLRVKMPAMPAVKKIKLKDAIEQGLVSFDISETGVYTLKGAVPDMLTVSSGSYQGYAYSSHLYDGYSLGRSIYDKDGQYIGFAVIGFSFRNNKKPGEAATVRARVLKSNILSGSAEVGSFSVAGAQIDELYTYHDHETYEINKNNGYVYGVITDEPAAKGKPDKPKVKLYQVCIDKKGRYVSVPLRADQYTVHKGKERGSKAVAFDTYVTSGSSGEFIFADQGVYTGIYCLYNKKFTASVVDAITIDGVEYTVKNGVIDKSYAPVFKGIAIDPHVESIRIGDKTIRTGKDFEIEYSSDLAAGKKSGSFRVIMHYNDSNDSYEFGGTGVIKYDISAADAVKL